MLNKALHGLAEILSGTFAHRRVKTRFDTHLSDILSEIDLDVQRQECLDRVLCRLDACKGQLRRYFCDHLGSEIAATAVTVKVLNLCLAKYHFYARDSILLSKPYGLIVDPINSCNLACPGCVHSGESKRLHRFDWSAGVLSEEKFDALLQRYGPYAIQATLCNYGEPLLNPSTPKFIRKAKAYLMRTTISTNMTAKRFDPVAYVNSGLDFMTLSIDGATQAVYEQFRKNGRLEIALENVRRLVAARGRAGKRSPVLNWQFLAFEHNAHEIDLALELARQLGVDQFTVATPFDVSWDDAKFRPACVPMVTHQFHADSDGRMIENWNPFPEEINLQEIERAFATPWLALRSPQPGAQLTRAHGQHTCHYLYKNMVMDANGRIIPCCAAPRPDADLTFSIFEDGAPDSFNTEKYRLARLSFANKGASQHEQVKTNLAPHCLNCDWYRDQETAHIDHSQLDHYLRAVGDQVFDEESRQILALW